MMEFLINGVSDWHWRDGWGLRVSSADVDRTDCFLDPQLSCSWNGEGRWTRKLTEIGGNPASRSVSSRAFDFYAAYWSSLDRLAVAGFSRMYLLCAKSGEVVSVV